MSEDAGASGFELTIGSATFEQEGGEVLSLLVENHVDMVDMLTVRLSLGEHQGDHSFSFGDAVSCKVGEVDTAQFDGEITAIEPGYTKDGSSTVLIRALDKTHRLARGRVTRIFEEMTDSDVVSDVGGECGLSVSAEGTSETFAYILQRNESNLAFLKRLAARNNYQLRVNENELIFEKAQFSDSGYSLEMGNISSLRIHYNTADQVQEVVVRGWDITAKEEIVGTAASGDVDAIGSGDLGMDLAGNFGDSTAYITDVPVTTQGAADELAKAEINRLARQFARGTATVQGTDESVAGGMVTISGMPEGSNGSFYVLACRQIITASTGWITEFSFCGTSYGT